jgi:hypothetical protein
VRRNTSVFAAGSVHRVTRSHKTRALSQVKCFSILTATSTLRRAAVRNLCRCSKRTSRLLTTQRRAGRPICVGSGHGGGGGPDDDDYPPDDDGGGIPPGGRRHGNRGRRKGRAGQDDDESRGDLATQLAEAARARAAHTNVCLMYKTDASKYNGYPLQYLSAFYIPFESTCLIGLTDHQNKGGLP